MNDQTTMQDERSTSGQSRSTVGLGKITVCRVGFPNEHGAQFVAVDEIGAVISEHFCSSNSWARRDLISPGHDCHVEKYVTRYPQGYEFIDCVDMEYGMVFPNMGIQGPPKAVPLE